mgnify:CR=1 FL=1
MAKIIGIIVVFASVLGGYVLSHGKIAALIQPFEVMIIGGAALGAFLQANPGYMTMHVLKKSLSMFGSRFSHAFYLEVLGLIYEILNKSRREGMMAIEADIEDAAAAVGFPVSCTIPSSRAIPLSLNLGTPVVKSEPKSAVAKQFGLLASLYSPAEVEKTKRGWRR